MGLRCSCGAIVPLAVATPLRFRFDSDGEIRTGTATYTANVCADRPELGTVTMEFVDTSGELPNRSFTFTSTTITNVNCSPFDGGCLVFLGGTGQVVGVGTFNFQATLQDNGPLAFDNIFIDISGFGQVVSPNPALPPGSVTALGCEPS
jgi:hypothetical protein